MPGGENIMSLFILLLKDLLAVFTSWLYSSSYEVLKFYEKSVPNDSCDDVIIPPIRSAFRLTLVATALLISKK